MPLDQCWWGDFFTMLTFDLNLWQKPQFYKVIECQMTNIYLQTLAPIWYHWYARGKDQVMHWYCHFWISYLHPLSSCSTNHWSRKVILCKNFAILIKPMWAVHWGKPLTCTFPVMGSSRILRIWTMQIFFYCIWRLTKKTTIITTCRRP